MYRTLAWHALETGTEVTDAAAVEALCRDWPAELVRRGDSIWLEVDGYFPEQEIRSAEVSAVVSHGAGAVCARMDEGTSAVLCADSAILMEVATLPRTFFRIRRINFISMPQPKYDRRGAMPMAWRRISRPAINATAPVRLPR